tara:strand:- start:337 stop:558 length:222 start_codon:yes stop_codon:yes gene_type:complete
MDKKSFIKLLAEILQTKDTLSAKSKLEKYDFDSLTVLELIAINEQYFSNVDILPDSYLQCENVEDLLKLFQIE